MPSNVIAPSTGDAQEDAEDRTSRGTRDKEEDPYGDMPPLEEDEEADAVPEPQGPLDQARRVLQQKEKLCTADEAPWVKQGNIQNPCLVYQCQFMSTNLIIFIRHLQDYFMVLL
ncbi:Hypothetical predicted protein [Podarcis lilfordi]|uniref:Uncharacterized protein n=1 Tax=Podarcis lilfordi TaxID=74358 RepID=A0AA35LGB6_9SAUR|nr:Hypothetical predicted protein [Podarcis lilfordi]